MRLPKIRCFPVTQRGGAKSVGIEEAEEKFVVGAENRTSVAKAGYGGVIYGTAEAVPFLKD